MPSNESVEGEKWAVQRLWFHMKTKVLYSMRASGSYINYRRPKWNAHASMVGIESYFLRAGLNNADKLCRSTSQTARRISLGICDGQKR